jgi:CTP-dependent riboflavin kinase
LPQIEGYAEDLLEVIAPVNLREALKLGDGDTAKVNVYI